MFKKIVSAAVLVVGVGFTVGSVCAAMLVLDQSNDVSFTDGKTQRIGLPAHALNADKKGLVTGESNDAIGNLNNLDTESEILNFRTDSRNPLDSSRTQDQFLKSIFEK